MATASKATRTTAPGRLVDGGDRRRGRGQHLFSPARRLRELRGPPRDHDQRQGQQRLLFPHRPSAPAFPKELRGARSNATHGDPVHAPAAVTNHVKIFKQLHKPDEWFTYPPEGRRQPHPRSPSTDDCSTSMTNPAPNVQDRPLRVPAASNLGIALEDPQIWMVKELPGFEEVRQRRLDPRRERNWTHDHTDDARITNPRDLGIYPSPFRAIRVDRIRVNLLRRGPMGKKATNGPALRRGQSVVLKRGTGYIDTTGTASESTSPRARK